MFSVKCTHNKVVVHINRHEMPSRSNWMWAKSPNYKHSVDKRYPYSEVPFLGGYKLIKIPAPNTSLELVDYWGEGRITADEGISGYANSYNVNHEYQTVSNGPDRGRKIPNRIPVISYIDCNTSAYIRDGSVANVTVMGAPINTSCAADIVRMIDENLGRVFVFGFDGGSADVINLEKALATKRLFHCSAYDIPSEMKSVTLFDSHRAYVNQSELRRQLYYVISSQMYDDAVAVARSSIRGDGGTLLVKVFDDCLKDGVSGLLPFAHRLWLAGETDPLSEYLPKAFKSLFSSEEVRIVNGIHHKALKLGQSVDVYSDSLLLATDNSDQTSRHLAWVFLPVWKDGKLYFQIKNCKRDMVLKLDVNTDSQGDRSAWGAPLTTPEDRTYFVLEPRLMNDELGFFIKNMEFGQALKVSSVENDEGGLCVTGDASAIGGQPWKIQSFDEQSNSQRSETGDTKEINELLVNITFEKATTV